jgi:truncated hemoglobin YjbI
MEERMNRTWLGVVFLALAVATAGMSSGCSDDTGSRGSGDQTDAGEDVAPEPDTPTPDATNNGQADVDNNGEMTTYERLGGEEAVIALVVEFGTRILSDPKINAFFSNSTTDIDNVIACLVLQITVVTGGPGQYPDAEGNCRDMRSSHEGLGISQQDYDDLLANFVDAGKAKNVPDDILQELSAIFLDPAFTADIIEDADNSATIYQRVGRKPAIDAIMGDFVQRVLADPKINGYFLNSSVDAARLEVCLERQVCQIAGGPCRYGQERIDPTEPLAEAFVIPCREMAAAHTGLGISQQDYDDLLGHLVDAAVQGGLPAEDLSTLASLLTDPAFMETIVEDPTNTASLYQRLGRKPGIEEVIQDFVGRVVANPQINGFFSDADADRLTTCLVRQVCAVGGGPCKYGEGVESELEINGQIVPCRAMVDSHAGITNPPGADDGAGITIDDFGALLADLVDALMAAQVTQSDIQIAGAALTALCADIVADPATCPE